MVMREPSEVDKFIDRWRATVAQTFTPEYVDGFLRRRRGAVEMLVSQALAQRRARGGERPEFAVEFLAYDAIVAEQRLLDAKTDPQVLRELMRHVDEQIAERYSEQSIFINFAVEYTDARTESIFLRDKGWDVVPLLVERPGLAFVADGHVVALRDWRGGLSIHPDRLGTLNHLYGDVQRAEEKLMQLREVIDIEPNNKEQLAKYASTMWRKARKSNGSHDESPHHRPAPSRWRARRRECRGASPL